MKRWQKDKEEPRGRPKKKSIVVKQRERERKNNFSKYSIINWVIVYRWIQIY